MEYEVHKQAQTQQFLPDDAQAAAAAVLDAASCSAHIRKQSEKQKCIILNIFQIKTPAFSLHTVTEQHDIWIDANLW